MYSIDLTTHFRLYLRKQFENLYQRAGEDLKGKIKGIDISEDEQGGKSEEDEENSTEEAENAEEKEGKEKGFRKLLTAKILLQYIKNNIDNFIEIASKEEIQNALKKFKDFSTYFSGFDTNRLNYYETKKEASTAVATRIINENLPRFSDNSSLFEKQQDVYGKTFDALKQANKVLNIKDKQGQEKEVKQFWTDIFCEQYVVQCLSQKQIEDYNEKIGDNNYLINLYNQLKQKEKDFKKLSPFKMLSKQIGCGEKKEFIKLITSPEELKKILKEIKDAGQKYFVEHTEHETVVDFIHLLQNRENYEGIYWNKQAINTISGKYFANWYDLQSRLKDEKIFKIDKKAQEQIKIPDAVELSALFAVLDKRDVAEKWKGKGIFFKSSIFEGEQKDRNEKIINDSENPSQALLGMIFADVKESIKKFQKQAIIADDDEAIQRRSDTDKSNIKLWMDETLTINRMLKYFVTQANKRKGNPQDSEVENLLKVLVFEFNWFKSYDAVRNFLTRKPQNEIHKLKLNFENATLADGWDVNKESDNFCIILQDGKNHQFLAVLKDSDKHIFAQTENNPMYQDSNSGWTKMNYKLLPGPNKMLPKVLFSAKWTEHHPTPENIQKIYKHGTFKKGDDFNREDLHTLIDFYKGELKNYPSDTESWDKIFNFNVRETSTYESIDQFYSEVEKQGYKLDFVAINGEKIEELVKNGKVYLFAIKNQDYNSGKQDGHKNNLHTMYWQAIFGNSENKPKLNGEAEIFYRPALDKKDQVKTKDKHGKEIIKNFRYSKEKFVFHCPITLNFCLKNHKINDLVNQIFTRPENLNQVCFLGIDRGEKHLAYYSLINQKGEILKQGSFNEINGTNYHDKLEVLAGDRAEARKNWKTIGTIKELKDGYISQVVREIVDLAIEHNAFIVLENLNSGFKNSRKKIEKSVYQKLELALAKKLNFVVDKDAKDGELMSVQKALQLTPPVSDFGDIENAKQYGIMLYTRANYTSQTDPKTGWRKTIYLKKGSEEYIKTQICHSFDEFGFDGTDYYFTYTAGTTGKIWTLYSGTNGKSLERYRGKPNPDDTSKWNIEKQDVVAMLDGVFEKYGTSQAYKFTIDKKSGTIKDDQKQEIELTKIKNEKINKDGHTSRESLRFALELLQQIRNSGPRDANGKATRNDDFILSPVRDEHGNHFDSRAFLEKENKQEKPEMPTSGDANGAYNIARKGIIAFKRIKENPEKPALSISDEDWDRDWSKDE